MPLDSTSTLAEVKAAYADNAAYDELGSVPKAKAFVTACRLLIFLLPTAAGQGGETITLDKAGLLAEMSQAKAWLSLNDPASTQRFRGETTRVDLSRFRG